MPREPRIFLPDVPCHVVTRGHNRDACFYSDQDYFVYLNYMFEACAKSNLQLHAYVLMTNHVHLLVTPIDIFGVSNTMHVLAGRYSRYFNKKYKRSGALWEGRFKTSLIDSERYLLACYRYIELNPVRAKMVFHPADYRWSSYHTNARAKPNPNISPHILYKALGSDTQSRTTAYRKLVFEALPNSVLNHIRIAATFSQPLGNSHFNNEIKRLTQRID